MSLPLRGAWIEIIDLTNDTVNAEKSLPLRGAWIEIVDVKRDNIAYVVAPPAGSVD